MVTAITKTGEHVRFQFMFGSFDEAHLKTAQESLTVTYVVPYHDGFELADLRKFVEAEHDENIKHAYRASNDHKRNERLGIAKASIESIRGWFSNVDVVEFTEAMVVAVHTKARSWIDCSSGRLVMTPQLRRTYLD